MARDEFERDMSDYLRARRRAKGLDIKGVLDKLLKKVPRVKMPEEVEVYHGDEKKEEPPKESMIAKIFKREPAGEEIQRTKMEAEDAIADMKEISKVVLNMIRHLPDDQIKKFKQSDDFEKLKTILKKHELIK